MVFAQIKNGIVINTIDVDENRATEEFFKALDSESEFKLSITEEIVFSNKPASRGDSFSEGKFIAPKPFESWILKDTAIWASPVEYPKDGKCYIWDEKKLEYIEFKKQ